MAGEQTKHILILAKTYPYPSTKYRETSCIAGMDDEGRLLRLFPVPFRYLQGEKQFSKWQWISARIRKAVKDHRPESHNIDRDSILTLGTVKTREGWADRIRILEQHLFSDPDTLEAKRQSTGVTLGVIKPVEIKELVIHPSKNPDWTEKEKNSLAQDFLFDHIETKKHFVLRKLPYDFYYRYICDTPSGPKEFKHMVTDWEAGALYWNCLKSHPKDWEAALRHRLECEFMTGRQVYFLMGTMHRFPNQWLITAFHYPPKATSTSPQQTALNL